jgi:hypothetical protein
VYEIVAANFLHVHVEKHEYGNDVNLCLCGSSTLLFSIEPVSDGVSNTDKDEVMRMSKMWYNGK